MSEKPINALLAQKEISIFRTSLIDAEDIARVKNVLDILIGEEEWCFDFEDVDNILRIHANRFVNEFLIQEFIKKGFECEELF